MSITIYSVVPKRLIEDAKAIEKHAEDQLEAWLALGQSEKYSKAVNQAKILRLAANKKDVYTRREILKNAGFTVKNLHKNRKENPTMKHASPAQLAARKRFAEMARSGAFKKATKRKANPTKHETIFKIGDMVKTDRGELGQVTYKKSQPDGYADVYKLLDVKAHDPYKQTFLENGNFINGTRLKKATKRKANPITETVIWGLAPGETRNYMEEIMYGGGQKLNKEQIDKVIAAATAAGYHSFRIGGIDMTKKPDFAGALNIRKKRKTNPMHKYTVLHRGTANVAGQVTASGPQAAKQKVAEKLGIPTLAYLVAKKTNPVKKTVSQKISQLRHEGYPQRQAVAVALSEQRAGKVKRNPAKVKYRNLATKLKGDQRVGYSVHLASQPGHNAIAWFSKKAEAVKVAQEAADRTGKDLAVSRVQIYFGEIE